MQQHGGVEALTSQNYLTTLKTLCALFLYIMETGRWQNSFGEITNIRGGIEEKNKKSVNKQWATHLYYTWPQHHLLECEMATWGPTNGPPSDDEGILKDMITTKLQHSTYLVSYIWFATKENKWEKKKKKIL